MENARLITETREALEQQTATAEVLGVINSSPGDLAPVFDAMLEKATQAVRAPLSALRTYDGERFHASPRTGCAALPEYLPRRATSRSPRSGSLCAAASAASALLHIADLRRNDAYRAGPVAPGLVELGGARSCCYRRTAQGRDAARRHDVYRQEVRPFTDKQIALLQNFAAQAVIAMENARLITETREALEQQTATAEVLGVINSSPGDLAPVFDAMLEKAMRLCEAAYGHLLTYDGERFRRVAARRSSAESTMPTVARRASAALRSRPRERASKSCRCSTSRRSDYAQRFRRRTIAARSAISRCAHALAVPLRKGRCCSALFTSIRQEVRPFSDKQIALLQNFAAQAVIAMENARLIRPATPARGAGAADRDRRSSRGHQQLAGRSRAGIRCDAGKGDATLRAAHRHLCLDS